MDVFTVATLTLAADVKNIGFGFGKLLNLGFGNSKKATDLSPRPF